jgi:hypothetical protein
VNIEYQLTTSGRYLIRAYRRNSYQDVVIGQAIENGAGFIATFDYDKFRDVLFGTPEGKAAREAAKGAEKGRERSEERGGEECGDAVIANQIIPPTPPYPDSGTE